MNRIKKLNLTILKNRDIPSKYSPLLSHQQINSNKIQQDPISEEPPQYDGKHFFFNFIFYFNEFNIFLDSQADIDEIISDSDDEIDLLYDPTLNCYYDPKTFTYYELNLS